MTKRFGPHGKRSRLMTTGSKAARPLVFAQPKSFPKPPNANIVKKKQATAAAEEEKEIEEEEEDDEQWEDDANEEAYDTQNGEEDEAMESGEDEVEIDEDEEEQLSGEEESESEDEEDAAENNPLANISPMELANLMGMINNMKKQDGPIVTTVHLKADGTTAQPTVDMSPRLDSITKLLGGKATFVGQYPAPLSATIMMVKDQTDKKLKVNKHVLAKPYDQDKGKLKGDFVLVRMDDSTTPCSLTVEEYEAYLANPDAPVAVKKSTTAAKSASGKKKGMTTEEAANLAKKKRKSAGQPEPDQNESEPEEEVSQPKSTTAAAKKNGAAKKDAPIVQAKKKQKK